jgi:hypothetical protein
MVAVGRADVTAIPELGYGITLHKTGHFYQIFVRRRLSSQLEED